MSSRAHPAPSLAVRLRSARHYRAGQLLAFGLDRVVRAGERGCPFPPQHLARLMPGSREPDLAALRSWGGRQEAIGLAPAWDPARHGDPRAGAFSFQGVDRGFGGPVDWDPSGTSLLWRFHLNYLDTAAALAAALPDGDWQPWLADLLLHHWDRCRPGRGAAWMPFPMAVRLMNLLRIWAILRARGRPAAELEHALALHTRATFQYLRARVERHLMGNHMLKELCALCCAARVWGSAARLERLMAALRSQTESQFLAGGGHEERSPAYHLGCLRDLAEVRAALGGPAPGWLNQALRAGLEFAEAIEHPDGDVPLFNDCELGGTPRRADLTRLVGIEQPAWSGVRAFGDEGFVAARLGGAHLVGFCGPVSADHQPAHAHCDILSFELSRAGQRIVGNRGTLAYGDGPDRLVSRTTASHSTVQIGDHEQVEIWGTFRVGWRGRPVLEEATCTADGVRIAGRYAWHPSVGVEHRRTLDLDFRGGLAVRDEIRGNPRNPVVARFWLPRATLLEASNSAARMQTGDQAHAIRADGATLTVRPEPWFPRHGERAPGLVAEVRPPDGRGGASFRTLLEPAG